MVDTEKIRIRMEAYDHRALDSSAKEIVEQARRTNARVSGPVPLPTRIERYTVLRSPHGNKKAREQFEMRTHKRVIDIYEANARTVEALNRLVVPAGVLLRSRPDRSGINEGNRVVRRILTAIKRTQQHKG
mgnify:CR=1 FL=1